MEVRSPLISLEYFLFLFLLFLFVWFFFFFFFGGGGRNFMVDFFDEKILIEPLLGVLCGVDVTFWAVGFIGGPVVALKAFWGV